LRTDVPCEKGDADRNLELLGDNGGIVFARHAWNLNVALASLATLIAAFAAPAQTRAQEPIPEYMAKLKPLIGVWRGDIKIHNRDGSIEQSVGTYEIKAVLDGTYLAWDARAKKQSEDQHSMFLLLTTYDVRKKAYVQSYFYPQTAFQVVEHGQFDDAAQEFRTTAQIDGASRDYFVRSVTKINDDGTLSYTNWGRYEDENAEVLDMEAIFRRLK
jgi:hypothetical protein